MGGGDCLFVFLNKYSSILPSGFILLVKKLGGGSWGSHNSEGAGRASLQPAYFPSPG